MSWSGGPCLCCNPWQASHPKDQSPDGTVRLASAIIQVPCKRIRRALESVVCLVADTTSRKCPVFCLHYQFAQLPAEALSVALPHSVQLSFPLQQQGDPL